MQTFSIVVPVFNEFDGISETVERLTTVCLRLQEEKHFGSCELIFVDDGSTDNSGVALQRLKDQHPSIKIVVLRFSRNFGHSAAVFAGLERASGDVTAIIDADLQDPPELLEQMVSVMRETGADVVYGQRRKRVGESLFKRLTAWSFYRLINVLSGTNIPSDTGDFRVINKEVRECVVELKEREPFLRGLVAWVGFKQVPFLYDRQARVHGQTKYPFKKMFRFAIQAIMSFSSFPLKLSIYLGLAGIFLATVFSVYALIIWIQGHALQGWTSIVILFSFSQSLILFMLGVVGLYVGRVHTSSQNRPRYILRKG